MAENDNNKSREARREYLKRSVEALQDKAAELQKARRLSEGASIWDSIEPQRDYNKLLEDAYSHIGVKRTRESRRKELSKALDFYGGDIDKALELYRNAVNEKGFEGIEKKMIPIVETFGTIRDRAALCVIGSQDADASRVETDTIIKRDRAMETRNGIVLQGENAAGLFQECVYIYHTYARLRNDIQNRDLARTTLMEYTAIYLQTYEMLKGYNQIMEKYSPVISVEDKEIFEKTIEQYQTFGEVDDCTGEGWMERKAKLCLDNALDSIEAVTIRLSQYKGAMEAIRKWTEENDCLMFMPHSIKVQYNNPSLYWGSNQILSKYYHRFLKSDEAKGAMPEELELCKIPDYDEVEPDEGYYNYIYKLANGIHEDYRKNGYRRYL